MKKVTKVLLLICGICGGTGVVLMIIGMLMGISRSQLWDSVHVSMEDFSLFGIMNMSDRIHDWTYDMENPDPDKWETHQFSEIRNLKVDVDAGLFKIEPYDGQDIQVLLLSNDHQTMLVQDGHTLKVQLDSGSWFRRRGKPIKVLFPKDMIFHEVDIDVEAGEGIIESIQGKKVEAEVGAGELTVTGSVQTQKSSWSVGAGNLQIEYLQSEKTEMSCKAGEIDATMDGKESDYQLEARIDVGSLTFGGSDWDSLGQRVHLGDKNADNKMEIDCAVGEVNISFTE